MGPLPFLSYLLLLALLYLSIESLFTNNSDSRTLKMDASLSLGGLPYLSLTKGY